MIQITKMAGVHPGQNGGTLQRKSESISLWIKRLTLLMMIGLSASVASAEISPIPFKGSIPENNSEISSFNELLLEFDFSEIVNEYGNADNWGVCYNAFHNEWFEAFSKTVTLYKGSQEDGEVLGRITTSYNEETENWFPDSKISVSFPQVEVIPGQLYTLIADIEVYALNKETSEVTEVNYLKEDPVILTYYGSSETTKAISVVTSSLEGKDSFDGLDNINIEFDFDIRLGVS
ncbi:MAG: hypothetical protein K2J87_06170, partial [Muribaculaceae bacterium]|nr:hypothetical protein [Muribaculaceae bacterium]